MIILRFIFVMLVVAAGMLNSVKAQETDSSPFALEFPELSSLRIVDSRSYVQNTNVSIVRFLVLNPAADSIDWMKIRVKINRQSANRICAQIASVDGKVLRCDLNRIPGFRLIAMENLLEIEAEDRSAKRFYKSFVLLTDASRLPKSVTPKAFNRLGFSGRKFAVVLGVSKYRYNDVGLGNLSFADDDADALVAWLRNEGGFLPDDILHLTNEAATLATVRDSLIRFLSKANETDLILFFLAGHGTPDPFNPSVLYYLMHDSKVADLKNTGFPMVELKRIIDQRLRSKRAIFLLDTCHSAGLNDRQVVGLGNRGMGLGTRNIDARDFDERILERVKIKNDVSQAATTLFGSTGRAVLTSSDVNEASRESASWGGGHGVFTWALLEGLKGKADTNGDRSITAEELFEFVRVSVRAETGGKQNPRLFTSLDRGLEVAKIK